MSLVFLFIGLLPPALFGWLLLSVLEGRHRLLTQAERVSMGMIIGLTSWSFVAFLLHIGAGLSFSLFGFLLSFAVVLIPLGIVAYLHRHHHVTSGPSVMQRGTFPGWTLSVLIVLVAWTVIKIAAGGMMLTMVPAYFDDSGDNWNLRGKAYFVNQGIELIVAPETVASGISSYPPSVPTMKAWLATLKGMWDEGLINSIHIAWYIACLALTYCALRRKMGMAWSIIGTYVLASLPLFLMQGTNAYADVYMAGHLLSAMLMLMYAAESPDRSSALGYLRIGALAVSLLLFTKNEGFILYTPLLCIAFAVSLLMLLRRRLLTMNDAIVSVGILILFLILTGGPWIGFKWAHGLGFGNAKDVGQIQFLWQPNVLLATAVNTFFEGNWLLLFPFLIALVILGWRLLLRPGLMIFAGFMFAAFGLQYFIFLFTGLSSEAIQQTGYARGIIQLIPIIVITTMLLLKNFIDRRRALSP